MTTNRSGDHLVNHCPIVLGAGGALRATHQPWSTTDRDGHRVWVCHCGAIRPFGTSDWPGNIDNADLHTEAVAP